ncbi:AMP-binding protein [Legionella dresdenensis]|uniref:AMP-binding protein n=1 Tax=Legionella dresdenensis TaxID=450200 RepID=A0ABV8CEH6_9GAMM
MTKINGKKLLNEWLFQNEKDHGDKVYLRQPRQGQWYEYTWGQVVHQARQVARFLRESGLQHGDRVAIYSKNCAEWFITDFGISLAGMVNVPLFANQHHESIEHVLSHAEIKMVFVGKLDNPVHARAAIPTSYPTAGFDYHNEIQVDTKWHEILAKEPLNDLPQVKPDDLYTIIYTSGTAGMPKGAVYTHDTIANYLALYPLDIARICKLNHYHLISYLPLAHVYERSAVQLGSITIPCDVSFVESLEKFAENLREIEPTFFTAVPRIWGVFQQKIEQKLPPKKMNILLKIPGLSLLIKNKIRRQLGLARCKNCFSGASHLPISIIEFFNKLGIKIQEGYGQSENLAYATFSMLEERKPGYVGTARLQVDLKLSPEENELLIKSPCLMKRYYKEPELTAATITEDGWLKTGDIAEIDGFDRVKILGRLSENFKNQKGEFVAPGPIEKLFTVDGSIEQLCLIGQGLPSNVLLVTLSETGREKDRDVLQQMLVDSLHQINGKLASYEKISHIIIVAEPWAPDNGLLTPTLKVKRRAVEAHYRELIDAVIEKPKAVVWDGFVE